MFKMFINRIINNWYTFLFKDTSLKSEVPDSLDMLPRQNRVGKLTFSFSALNL